MSHLKVVLLCKGRGGDSGSYKPNRDESQWWNRRDALVRCVSAFLHGPYSAHCTSRELVLIHDEDWTRIHMTKSPSSTTLPTEQNILSAWKDATSTNSSKSSSSSPWTCRVVRTASTGQGANDANAVQHMESKRQVLEHIQANSSIDFLRKHGLNSKADVVLRKTNKKALVQIWHSWAATATPKSSESPLASIFTDLLQKTSSSSSIIAGFLHESCDSELPCFDPPELPPADPNLHVVLFLGAVRDMHPSEHKILRSVCAAQDIPLTGVRLGPVAEFTSKILSVVAFHQARGMLGRALQYQVTAGSNSSSTESKAIEESGKRERSVAQTLHVFCSIPLNHTTLSTDLAVRQSPLWNIVRVTVVTLWRSHLMRSDASDVKMALAFLFQDGAVVSLEQDALVRSMSEQHQAAPCEFQILQALMQTAPSGKWTDGEALKKLLAPASLVLDFTEDDEKNSDIMVDEICAMPSSTSELEEDYVAVLLSCHGKPLPAHLALRKAAAKLPRVRTSRVVPAQDLDCEAATITMLQHFAYQERLFPYLRDKAKVKKSKRKKTKSE
ncbi:hypothetical protein AC1031_007342 [Aphanomyces cochlioides]|nr:hypothetical protein AC1031_007342 [Aphanomyces cochlioides]